MLVCSLSGGKTSTLAPTLFSNAIEKLEKLITNKMIINKLLNKKNIFIKYLKKPYLKTLFD
jgi:hypothetical protein